MWTVVFRRPSLEEQGRHVGWYVYSLAEKCLGDGRHWGVLIGFQVGELAASSARRGLAHPSWLCGSFLKWASSNCPSCPPSVLRLLCVKDGQLCLQRCQPQPRVGTAVPVFLSLTFMLSHLCAHAQLWTCIQVSLPSQSQSYCSISLHLPLDVSVLQWLSSLSCGLGWHRGSI